MCVLPGRYFRGVTVYSPLRREGDAAIPVLVSKLRMCRGSETRASCVNRASSGETQIRIFQSQECLRSRSKGAATPRRTTSACIRSEEHTSELQSLTNLV